MKYQSAHQMVDVGAWRVDDQFDPYPEGSRDKSAVACPDPASFPFLIPGHRYLFKHSNKNYPAQFWAEIVAYKVGCQMGVEVPPAFAAFNSNDEDRPAALIEWFYEWETEGVRYVPGSNFMNRMILNFDTRRGTQHNVGTILKLLRLFEARGLIEEGLNHWGKVFVFDAVIGNTDRHQDNWGVLWLGRGTEIADMRANFSPAFDNGTSLGHEILERNLLSLQDSARLEKYILRGRHHAKWSIKDEQRMQHAALVQLYADEFPEVRDNIVRCLEVDMGQLEAQLRELCDFDGGIPFTEARCDMVISLLNARIAALSAALGI